MTTAAAHRWVELINSGRCACPGCDGSLAGSQYPSWRVCVECRCHWRTSDVHGRRREGLFADPRCPARAATRDEDGPVDGHGAWSGAKAGGATSQPLAPRRDARHLSASVGTPEPTVTRPNTAARLGASSGRPTLLTTDP